MPCSDTSPEARIKRCCLSDAVVLMLRCRKSRLVCAQTITRRTSYSIVLQHPVAYAYIVHRGHSVFPAIRTFVYDLTSKHVEQSLAPRPVLAIWLHTMYSMSMGNWKSRTSIRVDQDVLERDVTEHSFRETLCQPKRRQAIVENSVPQGMIWGW